MNPLTSKPRRGFVVTLDGPAASGKSTTAKKVAEHLGWLYLDTGAMYRAVALTVLRKSIPLSDAERVAKIAGDVRIRLSPSPDGMRVLLDGEDVTSQIRTPEVDRAVGPVCEIPEVRDILVPQQRDFAEKGNLITDGRDQGTVVFPDADLKFYVTASLEERAKRRKKDQEGKGIHIPMADLMRDIEERDSRDSRRLYSPLRRADDAALLDTTGMTIDEQVRFIADRIRRKMEGNHGATVS